MMAGGNDGLGDNGFCTDDKKGLSKASVIYFASVSTQQGRHKSKFGQRYGIAPGVCVALALIGGPAQDLSNFQTTPIPILSVLTCSTS